MKQIILIFVVAVVCFAGPLAPAGVVAHYTFDSTLADSGGNGLDLTTGSGSANYAAGKFGNALDCINYPGGAGTGNYHYNASSLFDFGTGDFAVAFWYRSDHVITGSNGTGRQFDIGQMVTKANHSTGTAGWGFNLTNDGTDNPLLGMSVTGSYIDTNVAAPADDNTVYHHLVLQRSGDNVEGWLDGTRIYLKTGMDNVNVSNSAYAFAVGARGVLSSGALATGGGYGLDGRIDELWVFDQALSAGDIADLMTLNMLIIASNPSPANSAAGIDPSGLTLSWSAPGGGPYKYDVYLGTSADPNMYVSLNQTATNYTPSPELDLGTDYIWHVDVKDFSTEALLAAGGTWTFTTGGGVTNQSPYDGAENQGYELVLLDWDADALTASFDVYISTDANNLGSPANTTETEFLVDVDPNAVYYWAVDTKDVGGSVLVAGEVLSFSTGDLLAYWKLDDGSGTVAADASGNGRDAAVWDSGSWTTGANRGGLQCPSGDAAAVKLEQDLGSVNQLSASLWVKRGTPANSQYFFRNGALTEPWLNVRTNVTGSEVVVSTPPEPWGTTFSTGALLDVGSWYHLVITWDVPSRVVTAYLDGVEVGSSVRPAMDAIPLTAVQFGSRLNGPIDDLRVFNAVLSAQDVADLYGQRALAMNPVPADEAVRIAADVTCQWIPGDDITGQVFQLDDDPNLAADLLEEITLLSTDTSRDPLGAVDLDLNKTYYWRIVSEQDSGASSVPGNTWSFTTIPPIAGEPDPDDGAVGVPQNKILGWLPGAGFDTGDSHEVYMAAGTTEADLPALPTATVSTEAFEPDLAFETAYVWRVDEVIGGVTYTGNVWTFTTGAPICDPPLPADANGDCMVDLTDFAELAATWLDCTLTNGDCP